MKSSNKTMATRLPAPLRLGELDVLVWISEGD
jgi:virulence-associated protein VagC